MIQPNEKLLPGNVVMWRNRFYTLTKGDIYSMDYLRNFYSPIPLTPEILVQWCGASQYINRPNKWVFDNRIEITKYENIDGYDVYFKNSFVRTISHLHELQNLIYFLSGEEMPVNIPNN